MSDITPPGRTWQHITADQLRVGDVVIDKGVIKTLARVNLQCDHYVLSITTPSIHKAEWLEPDVKLEVFGVPR